MSNEGYIARQMIATEKRSEQCKIYVEPTVKAAIEGFAAREGLTFSEAGRALLLNSEELDHELKAIWNQRNRPEGESK